jgi:hypothetical protein
VAGHKNFGCKELEECGIKWGRMAGNSEEGQGPQRAVVPMMMMIFTLRIIIYIYFNLVNVYFALSPLNCDLIL